MRSVYPKTVNLPIVIGAATILGISIMCAATWIVWALGGSATGQYAAMAPVLLAIGAQGALTVAMLWRRQVRTGLAVASFICGLVLLLLVGGVLGEMIHCSFDRIGCINL